MQSTDPKNPYPLPRTPSHVRCHPSSFFQPGLQAAALSTSTNARAALLCIQGGQKDPERCQREIRVVASWPLSGRTLQPQAGRHYQNGVTLCLWGTGYLHPQTECAIGILLPDTTATP